MISAMKVATLSREVKQDAGHTLRLWGRRPWHTGFAILALAIGIGANTGVFSVVNALLLRSLPFQNPERLAALLECWWLPRGSATEFHNWRQQSAYLADVALVHQRDVNLGGVRESQRAHLAHASSNFFSLLGTQPVLGRGFAPGEDTPGPNQVAVIGYGLWQQLFAGERRALGSTIVADGVPLTIIGVAPPGFDYPRNTMIWRPAAFTPGDYGWEAIARLKPGITWPQAREAYTAEFGRLWPNFKIDKMKHPPKLTPLQDELAGPAKNASLMLMAGVVLILLIACTNVANLLIARTADRTVELSIRSAMGASRARLSRQLLTECMLLSLAASIAGLFVAFWTTSIAARLQPAPLASQAYSILDSRVLGFTVAVSILSGLLFGVLPSLYAGRAHTFGARGASDGRGSRLIRESLAAAQIMLTIVLLAASVSVGRAFLNLMRTDRGFDLHGLVTVNVSLEGTTQSLSNRQLRYFEEALERVRRLPGVRSASATEFLPIYAKGFIGGRWQMDGRPARENSMIVPVLPDYFRTMGGRILYGRELTDADVQGDAKVALVNELFASEFGPPADAVGRQIAVGKSPPWRIIGVVRGMDYMVDGANSLQIFVPSHSPGGMFSTFVARVNGRAEDRLAMVRDAIQSVDPQVPVFGVKTMAQRLDDALARPQFYRTAVFFFAGFALLLAVIGIYGIVSYTVARRTHEMGIRMALGTTPDRLRMTLLRQGLLTIAAGAVPGIAGAMLIGRFLESLVEGAKSVSPVTCAASVLFIAAIAAAGIWTATRPIVRLDVMEILRTE
jgi:predicted permease